MKEKTKIMISLAAVALAIGAVFLVFVFRGGLGGVSKERLERYCNSQKYEFSTTIEDTQYVCSTEHMTILLTNLGENFREAGGAQNYVDMIDYEDSTGPDDAEEWHVLKRTQNLLAGIAGYDLDGEEGIDSYGLIVLHRKTQLEIFADDLASVKKAARKLGVPVSINIKQEAGQN
ncbi:hypothetical protein IJG20_01200 [Candidatus Saccharibacteria bacterium]|nr:hypothetical protein [Candidatus Saccharibacteria bacterium]